MLFFIFPRAAGRKGPPAPPAPAGGLFRGGVTAARAARLFRSGAKKKPQGETVLSRRRHRAKARLAPPKRRVHMALSRGTQALSRRRWPRASYFAAASPQRGRLGSPEATHKKKPQRRNSSFAPQASGEGAARSPETTGSHGPLAGHTGSFVPQAAAGGLFRGGVTATRATRQSAR